MIDVIALGGYLLFVTSVHSRKFLQMYSYLLASASTSLVFVSRAPVEACCFSLRLSLVPNLIKNEINLKGIHA